MGHVANLVVTGKNRLHLNHMDCFPTDKRDYVTRKRGWEKACWAVKLQFTVHYRYHQRTRNFEEDRKFTGSDWQQNSLRKLGLKIPEVSSGFPRGTSERLQAWSQQIKITVVGSWVNNQEYFKESFSKVLC